MNPAVDLAERAVDEDDADVYEHTLTGGQLLELRAGDHPLIINAVADLEVAIVATAVATAPIAVDTDIAVVDGDRDDRVASAITEEPIAIVDDRAADLSPIDTADPGAAAPWWTLAACRGLPTGWWFPGRGDHVSGPLARAICAECPVAEPCLESARAEEELVNVKFTFGIRGGLSAAERAG